MHLIQFYVIKAVFCRLTGTLRWQLPVPRLVRVRLDADDGLRRQSQNLRRCRTRFAGSRNTPNLIVVHGWAQAALLQQPAGPSFYISNCRRVRSGMSFGNIIPLWPDSRPAYSPQRTSPLFSPGMSPGLGLVLDENLKVPHLCSVHKRFLMKIPRDVHLCPNSFFASCSFLLMLHQKMY